VTRVTRLGTRRVKVSEAFKAEVPMTSNTIARAR